MLMFPLLDVIIVQKAAVLLLILLSFIKEHSLLMHIGSVKQNKALTFFVCMNAALMKYCDKCSTSVLHLVLWFLLLSTLVRKCMHAANTQECTCMAAHAHTHRHTHTHTHNEYSNIIIVGTDSNAQGS